jgi:hypothetical protein
LGDYFRRIKSKGGIDTLILATANKMVTIYYGMTKDKVLFTPVEKIEYQKRLRLAEIAHMEENYKLLKRKVL